jgi:AcrR family transcriptional regulator
MDAFLTCAARHGIEGATLERIAAEAGLSRPLIRHHLGNRSDMVDALALHVIQSYDRMLQDTRAAIAAWPGAEQLIALLFDEAHTTDPRLNLTFQALTHAIGSYPQHRDELVRVMQEFYDLTAASLQQARPEAGPEACRVVGQAIIDLFMSQDAVSPLAPPPAWRSASREAALRLLGTL